MTVNKILHPRNEYMCKQMKEEEDTPELKIGLVHQYNTSKS